MLQGSSSAQPNAQPGTPARARDTILINRDTIQITVQPSPTDRIETGVAAVSALTSLLAVVIAVRALKEQIATPARERKMVLFQALMVTPALELLPRLEADGAALVASGLRRLKEQVDADVPFGEVQKGKASLVREFKELCEPATFRLLGAARAWGDEDLKRCVNDAISKMVDAVTRAIDRYPQNNPGDASAESLLREGIAACIGAVVHHDGGTVAKLRG